MVLKRRLQKWGGTEIFSECLTYKTKRNLNKMALNDNHFVANLHFYNTSLIVELLLF